MTSEIKQRIEMIKNGEVPHGYIKEKDGIYPADWQDGIPVRSAIPGFKSHGSGEGEPFMHSMY